MKHMDKKPLEQKDSPLLRLWKNGEVQEATIPWPGLVELASTPAEPTPDGPTASEILQQMREEERY